LQYRFIESTVTIWINGIITDMFWSSPAYHENGHSCKIWRLVIIFAHRWFFRALIFAWSLASPLLKGKI